MTRQKSFKSRVRTRMGKTGERYTTARRQLLGKVESEQSPERPSGAVHTKRLSETALLERTGRGWDEWFALLDAWGATEHTHAEIAGWLSAEHQVDNWSVQSMTVGYELARGMRAPGQNSRGEFEASVTRTVAVPADRLFAAFADESIRARWLPSRQVRVRTATAPKSLRADWPGGSSRIVVGFTPMGDAKTRVAVVHEKLADADAVVEMKTYWRERLTELKQLLEA